MSGRKALSEVWGWLKRSATVKAAQEVVGVESETLSSNQYATGGMRVTALLCDADIRQPLHDWIHRRHARGSATGILHELKIPRPSARIDLAVVNGKMVGFEIKSDIDSLARLNRQAAAFEQVFDRVCMVTTEKHLSHAMGKIPSWWGVVVPSRRGNKVVFKPVRSMRRNPTQNNSALLYALTRAELVKILTAAGLSKGHKGKRKDDLIEVILGQLPARALRSEARRVLRLRDRTYSSVSNSESMR